MNLKLVKKFDASDKQPLVIHTDYNNVTFTKKVGLGETIEVEDQLGYQILSLYPGLFEQPNGAYKTKTMHAEGK